MSNQEFWLSGPVEGIHPLLQPAAHALLQAGRDIETMCSVLNESQLWQQVGNAATVGFHLNHVAGATERLFTYARGEALNDEQIAAMKAEKTIAEARPDKEHLLNRMRASFDAAIAQLGSTSAEDFTKTREVGRAKLPSTVIGLLFHGAEHAQRHCGQIATTVRLLK